MLAVGGDESRVRVVGRREEESCHWETVACAGGHEGGALIDVFRGAIVPMFVWYFL